jgi:hypothetical protein
MPTLFLKQLPITQYWQNATDSLYLEFKFVLVALRQYSTLYKGTNFILHFQINLENYLDDLTHPCY